MADNKDELRTLLLELTAEDLQDYYNMCAKIREKERELKIAVLKVFLKGNLKGKMSEQNIIVFCSSDHIPENERRTKTLRD